MSIVDEEVVEVEEQVEQTEQIEEVGETEDDCESEESEECNPKSFSFMDILFLLFSICFIGACLYGVNMVFNAHDYSNTDFMNIFMR